MTAPLQRPFNKRYPHPEERAEGARLEGWTQARHLCPSFETARYAGLLRMRWRLLFATRFLANNEWRIEQRLRPHPEERARSASVSKDGSRARTCPSFETARTQVGCSRLAHHNADLG